MPKNIVIFSDGTGQEGGKGANTNIYKLYNMVEDRTPNQISFYDPGLGTGFRKLTGSVGGAGISENIQQCYSFIFNNFEAGDQIYLFGFSRGAATVRSLSSFIHYFGILPKARPDLIKQAYKIYKIADEQKRKSAADEFIAKHHTMWTKIKFIGCFDTVAALGIPVKPLSLLINEIPWFQHSFHNFKLSESVENAYHALSIDDERKTFHPILWNEKQKLTHQNIKQVWFCGMHTDIGGGYDRHELSDIALIWMRDKAKEHNLLIYSESSVCYKDNPIGFMHNSRDSFWTKLYRKKCREINPEMIDKPIIHQSVLERSECSSIAKYKPWILNLDYDIEKQA